MKKMLIFLSIITSIASIVAMNGNASAQDLIKKRDWKTLLAKKLTINDISFCQREYFNPIQNPADIKFHENITSIIIVEIACHLKKEKSTAQWIDTEQSELLWTNLALLHSIGIIRISLDSDFIETCIHAHFDTIKKTYAIIKRHGANIFKKNISTQDETDIVTCIKNRYKEIDEQYAKHTNQITQFILNKQLLACKDYMHNNNLHKEYGLWKYDIKNIEELFPPPLADNQTNRDTTAPPPSTIKPYTFRFIIIAGIFIAGVSCLYTYFKKLSARNHEQNPQQEENVTSEK